MKKYLIPVIFIAVALTAVLYFTFRNTLIDLDTFPENFDSKKLQKDFKTKYSDDYGAQLDTLYSNDMDHDAYSNDPHSLGYSWNMAFWKNKPIAKYYSIDCNRFSVMETKKHEFIAVCGASEITSPDDFEKTVKKLTDAYGTPEIVLTEFYGSYTNYIWTTRDRIIELVSGKNSGEGTLKITVDEDKKSTRTNPETEEEYLCIVYIINKKYNHYIENMTFKSGDWVYLH